MWYIGLFSYKYGGVIRVPSYKKEKGGFPSKWRMMVTLFFNQKERGAQKPWKGGLEIKKDGACHP
jgi:hypothetical protein